MKNRKYQYVFFDAGTCKNGRPDSDNYYYICTEDLRNQDNVIVVSYPMDYMSSFIHKLHSVSNKISNKLKIQSINKIWYPLYFDKKKTDSSKTLCFVIYGYYIKPNYLRYLKSKYSNCKIVKIHRDSYDIWRSKNPEYSDSDIENLFDLQMSYDLGDSQKHGMIHFDEIESKTSVQVDINYSLQDVFFAGAGKDRLPLLLSIYDHLTSIGLKCFFYLTNTKKCDQVKRDGILYADQNMSYREMLHYTVNSKAVLEVNQGCVDGFTSRFLESVMYNKRLLTNNFTVKNNRYYDNKYICCFERPEDIKAEFINDLSCVNFNYKDEFSPIHLIQLIEESLK